MLEFKNQLKRDYQKDPLQYGENPEYEDLYFLYITCNLTCDEISPYLGISRANVNTRLRKMKIKKSKELKTECLNRIFLTKYGVNRPSKCEEVKNKTRKTCREKYGTDAYFQTDEFKEKSKNTCLEKYGVEYGSQSEEFKTKMIKHNMEKYGVPQVLMNREIIEKGRETCLIKWGTPNISNSHINSEILELLNNKDRLLEYINSFEVCNLKEIAECLGITYDGIKKKLHQLGIWDKIDHKISKAELELLKLFPTFHKTRQILKPLEIDLYNEQYKLGIEFNGLYWHSEIYKNSTYHQDKSKLAESKDIFLFHIFEHEWVDEHKKPILVSMINNILGNNQVIGARKCIIKQIDSKQCNKFLNENHLQGQDNSSIRIGLFYNDFLLSVMTFCKPRFNNNYEYELSRFCSHLGYNICGGASKLFKYFINNYNPSNIISYSNISKTRGLLYKTLGFKLINISSPNYIWFKGLETLSRYQCQKHLLTDYQYLGNTENEIMHNRGYLKLYDCGNKVWVWNNS